MMQYLRPSLLALITLFLPMAAALADSRPETVHLQLKWRHQFQFAGYYMAQEKGYYKEAGLEVRIAEGRSDIDPVTEVLAGRAQYAVGASELVLERSRGRPVVALAAIMQHSPLVLFARAGSGVRSVKDLESRRLMLLPTEAEAFAFLRRSRVAVERIRLVPPSFAVDDLIGGRVDALSGYATDEGFLLEQAGFPYLAFSPRAVGIDFYGDTLFTSEQQIARHPAQVAAFRAASLKGWHYALAHPEEAVELILSRYGTRHSREHLQFEAERLAPLIQSDLAEIGQMTAGRWQRIAAAYSELDMVPADYAIDGLLYRPPQPPEVAPWAIGSIAGSLALALAGALAAFHMLRLHRGLQAQMRHRDQAECVLQASQERLRLIFESAPLAAMVYDREARIREWNHRAEEIFGWPRQEVLGRPFFDYMVPEEARPQVERIVATIYDGQPIQYSLNHNLTRDGRTILCEWSNAIFHDDASGEDCVIAMAADVTQREQVQQALHESESRYRSLLEASPFPVTVTRLEDSSVVYLNQRAAARLEVEQQSAGGRYATDFWVDVGQRQRLIEELRRSGAVADVEARLRNTRGEVFWALVSGRLMQDRNEATVVIAFADISERKRAESMLQELNGQLAFRLQEINILQEKLQEQAIRDALTGLFNRRYLDETLERELARAKRDGYSLVVAMLDIDRFKRFNDTHGHRAGDEMLRALGAFLRHNARNGDIPCRYGGEEFLLVLPGIDQQSALQRVEAWRAAFAALQVPFGNLTLQATLSVGLACYPDHGTTPDGLIDAADVALYRAKENGRNQVILAVTKSE
jgi:diguanylate cyclase (GGDEF)-like protein/PAS domain S-box-containing protein